MFRDCSDCSCRWNECVAVEANCGEVLLAAAEVRWSGTVFGLEEAAGSIRMPSVGLESMFEDGLLGTDSRKLVARGEERGLIMVVDGEGCEGMSDESMRIPAIVEGALEMYAVS